MKTKYILIYIFVGIAFLAVSAWVFFTRGRNAKAIKAKYRLGGILLTCLALLSVASCEGGLLTTTCYDSIIEVQTENVISWEIKSSDSSYKPYEISPGDIISVGITSPTCEKYVLSVLSGDFTGEELQRAYLVVEDTENAHFEVTLSPDLTYKGKATLVVRSVVMDKPEKLSDKIHGGFGVTIR